MKRIKSTRILTPAGVLDGYVYFEGGVIREVSARELPAGQTWDVGSSYVSPGFIDIHTHGGGGYDFFGTVEDILQACNFHLCHGTTAISPTLSTAPFAAMAQSTARIARAMVHPQRKSTILGAHLEGPYLSASQAGGQAPGSIVAPAPEDYLPLLEQQAPAIARWTYAPENDPDGAFCDALVAHGVVPAAGHTDAIYSEMKVAMAHGCNLVTHLYSCTSTVTRDHGFRRPGVIETAWLEDDLFVEIIADGKHLPPELIRLILKIKGPDRVALITDSMSVAGTQATAGSVVRGEYLVEDGVCKLPDRSAFAGSIATADRLLRVLTREVGVPVEEAVPMLTRVPAQIMGLRHKGSLLPGCDADLVVFDEAINVSHVFTEGALVCSNYALV